MRNIFQVLSISLYFVFGLTVCYAGQFSMYNQDTPEYIATFSSLSGLNSVTQIIEYRNSNSPLYSTSKMPGVAKYGNVTLYNVSFVNNNMFWKFSDEISMNTISRATYIITNTENNITFTLHNAWPTSMGHMQLDDDGNIVKVNQLTIAHEGLTISTQ